MYQRPNHLFGGNDYDSVQDAKEWAIEGLKADAKTYIIPRIYGGLPSDEPALEQARGPFPDTTSWPYIEAKTAAQIFVQKFAFSNHALLIRLCELMGGNKDLVKPIMSHVDDVTVLHLSLSAHLSAHVDDITVSEMRKLFDDKECSNQNYRAWEVLCHFFRPEEKKALYQLLHRKIDEYFDHLLTEVDEDVDDLALQPPLPDHHTTEHFLHTTRLQNPYILSS